MNSTISSTGTVRMWGIVDHEGIVLSVFKTRNAARLGQNATNGYGTIRRVLVSLA